MKKSKLPKLLILVLLVMAFASVVVVGIFQQDADNVVSATARSFPEFQSVSLLNDAQVIDEKTLKGKGYQLVNVWASWCGVCLSEHDFLVELQSQGVPIIGLNYRDKKKAAKRYLIEQENPYNAVIYDPNGRLAIDLGVIGTPETYLVDNEGKVVKKAVGRLTNTLWNTHFSEYFNEG